ncbi:hypothetical protein OAW29_03180 [Planktomarina temperata]|nr:hypothetical protein [Planktomarina temperata]
MLTTHDPTKIAALNDAARKSFSGCRVYMTPGVQALYQTQAIVARVQYPVHTSNRSAPLLFSAKGGGFTAQTILNLFKRIYGLAGIDGASSLDWMHTLRP